MCSAWRGVFLNKKVSWCVSCVASYKAINCFPFHTFITLSSSPFQSHSILCQCGVLVACVATSAWYCIELCHCHCLRDRCIWLNHPISEAVVLTQWYHSLLRDGAPALSGIGFFPVFHFFFVLFERLVCHDIWRNTANCRRAFWHIAIHNKTGEDSTCWRKW